MRSGERGVTLAEILVLLAIAGLVLGVSLPAFSRVVRGSRMRAAAFEMVSAFRSLRHRAITESRTHGLVFRPEGGDWSYALHADGDGDGLRSHDVRQGTDPPLGDPRRLSDRHPTLRPGFLRGDRIRRVPPQRGFLRAPTDPVRFGNSDIVSCSATGRCSSGTLYLTDGSALQWAIVFYGVTGRIRVVRYDAAEERWHP